MKYITLAALAVLFGMFSIPQEPAAPTQEKKQTSETQRPEKPATGTVGKTAKTAPEGATPEGKKAEPNSKPATAKEPKSNLFWIFLKTGKSTEGVAAEKVESMQAEHIANFKRLASEGKLLTAGPMQDPEKMLRGMVIVKAENYAEIEEMFSPDPYVQAGYLKTETQRMGISHGKINTQITPQGMSEFLMVMFDESKDKTKLSKDETSETELSLKSLTENEELRLAITFLNQEKPRRGVLVFRKPKDDESRKGILGRISEIPAVKNGKWRTRVLPLLMGKGSLNDSQR